MTTIERPVLAPDRCFTEGGAIDFGRWPDLRPPAPAPKRAAIARVLLRKIAHQTGVRVEVAGERGFGPVGGPVMRITDPAGFFARAGRDGKIGFGESYMAGKWRATGDLARLLTHMAASMRGLVPPRLQFIRRWYEPKPPAEEDNDPDGSRRNISRHYDLSNELFSLFLDQTMTYSSALFEQTDEGFEVAQARKIDRLLDATGVGPGTRVLEIGTGWGELSLRAARRGADVTTLTLSVEQAALARQRLEQAGVGDRVEVLVQDYRSSTGQYDAIVSVEMVEAVGEKWWPTFFRTLEDRLAPGGRIGLQSILMGHGDMVAAKDSWTWIHKYVFPGGIVPSLDAIQSTLAGHTELRVLQRHHFGSSYAETLRRWREAFQAREAEVEALGFDLGFRRMWEFYLAYSEAGFRSGYLDVAQLVLSREEA